MESYWVPEGLRDKLRVISEFLDHFAVPTVYSSEFEFNIINHIKMLKFDDKLRVLLSK